MPEKGYQIYAELYDCDSKLSRADDVRDIFVEGIISSGMTIVQEAFQQFEPHGVTITLILSESHAVIHTWPEHNHVSIDIFTCVKGGQEKAVKAIEILKESFKAREAEIQMNRRGFLYDEELNKNIVSE